MPGFDMFQLFTIIGIVAFAASGAMVAMEEKYDIFGVLVLGLVTAFGGGIIRNLLIGIPVTTLWNQGPMLITAAVSIIILYLLPDQLIKHWKKGEAFFDAIGLSAFAIQGALYAVNAGLPLSAVMAAAMLTGIGGGIIRDMMAGRKPLVFRDEIYACWALAAGLAIGLLGLHETWQLGGLFAVIIILRMLSVHFRWKLPRRALGGENQTLGG